MVESEKYHCSDKYEWEGDRPIKRHDQAGPCKMPPHASPIDLSSTKMIYPRFFCFLLTGNIKFLNFETGRSEEGGKYKHRKNMIETEKNQ